MASSPGKAVLPIGRGIVGICKPLHKLTRNLKFLGPPDCGTIGHGAYMTQRRMVSSVDLRFVRKGDLIVGCQISLLTNGAPNWPGVVVNHIQHVVHFMLTCERFR